MVRYATTGGFLVNRDLGHVTYALRMSGVVVAPSDTGFALLADAGDVRAVRALRIILGMETDLLSVSFSGKPMLEAYISPGLIGMRLVSALMPGPLTIVAPMTERGRQRVGSNLGAAETLGGRLTNPAVESQITGDLELPLTTTAIRYPDSSQVYEITDAIEIVREGIIEAEETLRYTILACAVEAEGFSHNSHSTVVEVGLDGTYRKLRSGAIDDDALHEASRTPSNWEFDDWT